jgi:hypothetical protein
VGTATYHTDAETLAIAQQNQPRFENIGDTSGSALLIEKGSTNLTIYGTEIDQFTLFVNATSTGNVATSPLGDTTADLVNFSSANLSRFQNNISFPINTNFAFSIWTKNTATILQRLVGPGVQIDNTITSLAEWTRSYVGGNTLTGTNSTNYQIRNNQLTEQSVLFWGAQIESGTYATSLIPTSQSYASRYPDILWYSSSNAPSWAGKSSYLTKRYRLRTIYSSNDLTGAITGSVSSLFKTVYSTKEEIMGFHATGSGIRMKYLSGAVSLSSSIITFQKNQWIDLEINKNADSVVFEVASASTGNGRYSESSSSFKGHADPGVVWVGSTTGSIEFLDAGIKSIVPGRYERKTTTFGVRNKLKAEQNYYAADPSVSIGRFNATSSISMSVAVVARADDLTSGIGRILSYGFASKGWAIQQTNSAPDSQCAFAMKDETGTTRTTTSGILSRSLTYTFVATMSGSAGATNNVVGKMYLNGVSVGGGTTMTGYTNPLDTDVLGIGALGAGGTPADSWTILHTCMTENYIMSDAEILAWHNSVTASFHDPDAEILSIANAKYCWSASDIDVNNSGTWVDRISGTPSMLTGTVSVAELIPVVK